MKIVLLGTLEIHSSIRVHVSGAIYIAFLHWTQVNLCSMAPTLGVLCSQSDVVFLLTCVSFNILNTVMVVIYVSLLYCIPIITVIHVILPLEGR